MPLEKRKTPFFRKEENKDILHVPKEKEGKPEDIVSFGWGYMVNKGCDNYESYVEEINQIMQLNKNKLTFYQQGFIAMSEIKKVY